jgi:cytoskeletal protein CcmA (bactofilin family)
MQFNDKQGEGRFSRDFLSSHHQGSGQRPLNQMHRPARLSGVDTGSIIDQQLLVIGDLEGKSRLQIDGQVEGNIRCNHVLVGREGTVTGTVTADEIVVRGQVKGTIRANRVIYSDVFHKTLAIEEGACFQGHALPSNDPMNVEAELVADAELETVTASDC